MFLLEKRYLLIALYKARVLLKTEGSRTYLRYLWWLLDPFLELCLFYTVFGVILQRGGTVFAAQLLIGVIVMRFFMATTISAPNLFIYSEDIILSVALPKYIFPLSHVIAHSIKYIFLLIVLYCFLLAIGVKPTLGWFAILFLSTFYIVFVLGVTMLLSGITPYCPDIDQLYSKVSMILYWGSGVFYIPQEFVPPQWLPYFYANPLAAYIQAFRDCMLHDTMNFSQVGYLIVVSCFTLGVGYFIILRNDKQYPKVITRS